MTSFQGSTRQKSIIPKCCKRNSVWTDEQKIRVFSLLVLLDWAVCIMLDYFAAPVLHGVTRTCWESGAPSEVDNKMICKAFINEIPLERTGEASGSAPGVVKSVNQKHYRIYLLFCCLSIHHCSENQPQSTVKASEGLRGKKNTLPLAVHVLLLLMKSVLAAFVERMGMQCSAFSCLCCWTGIGPKPQELCHMLLPCAKGNRETCFLGLCCSGPSPIFFFLKRKFPFWAKYFSCGKSSFCALYFDFSWVLYFPVSNSLVGKKSLRPTVCFLLQA